MEQLKTWVENDLVLKTNEFINSLSNMSNKIEDRDIYQIKNKLQNCLDYISVNLLSSVKATKRIDRIRSYVKINCAIDECRGYLELIEMLKYAPTKDYKKVLDNINEEINNNYHITLN